MHFVHRTHYLITVKLLFLFSKWVCSFVSRRFSYSLMASFIYSYFFFVHILWVTLCVREMCKYGMCVDSNNWWCLHIHMFICTKKKLQVKMEMGEKKQQQRSTIYKNWKISMGKEGLFIGSVQKRSHDRCVNA